MKKELFNTINQLGENSLQIIDLLDREKELLNRLMSLDKIPVRGQTLQIQDALRKIEENRNLISDFYRVTKKEPEAIQLGILYNSQKSHGLMQITDYLEGITEHSGLRFILFTIDELDLDKKVVSGTLVSQQGKVPAIVQIPSLIYNLALLSRGKSIKKMRQLRTMVGKKIINPINRFKQDVIFEIISSFSKSEEFLLPFSPLNPDIITECLQKHQSLFLIPETGLYHPKTLVLKKNKETEELYSILIGVNEILCKKEEIFNYLRKIIQNKKYLVFPGFKTLL